MNIKFPMLEADQIEVKVKQIGKPSEKGTGSVSLLLYKTARTDMDMLDKVVGAMNWETDYKEIKGNLYCGIGIHDADSDNWVWKWDCGTESREDEEGNQKKGEASDAFKRAGFKWGVGRELYTGPRITVFLPVELNQYGKPVLKERHHKYDGFTVGDIAYEDGRITRLRIDDSQGIAVFSYPKTYSKENAQKRIAEAENEPEPIPKPKSLTTCERCQKPIKGGQLADKTYLKPEQIIGASMKEFHGAYCYRCLMDLRAKRDGGAA